MTSLFHCLGFASAALCCALPVRAAPLMEVCTSAGGCGVVSTVTDAQLASIAGKFSISGGVVGLQLTILSSWQSGGQDLKAQATFSLNLPSDGKPGAFTTFAAASGSETGEMMKESPSTSTVNSATTSGSRNVDGVSQVIQVAGDGNHAVNRAGISMSTASFGALPNGNSAAASYQSADGSEARAVISGNSALVQLTMAGGAGTASQDINVINNSIRQHIQVSAAQQTVTNELHLQLQMAPMTSLGLAEQGFARALGALRGH